MNATISAGKHLGRGRWLISVVLTVVVAAALIITLTAANGSTHHAPGLHAKYPHVTDNSNCHSQLRGFC
jgi:uncharacterized membrane protein